MGWDCTLHVVDPASLGRFAGRLLRPGGAPTAFDDAFEDADALVAKTLALIEQDARRGARALGQLALMFVSAETPHAYCRGFALSLWDEEVLGPAPPARLCGTIESALAEVTAAYPQIRGLVPRVFDQNHCVGPFVAAADVPALLAHVEAALASLSPGDRVPYRPLVTVLRVAAGRGMAYWEGTDLPVAQTSDEWLRPPLPVHVQIAPGVLGVGDGPLVVRVGEIVARGHFQLHRIDTSVFPPAVTTLDGFQVTAAAHTPTGELLARAADDETRSPYQFSLRELPSGRPVAARLPFEPHLLRAARDAVLMFPDPYGPADHDRQAPVAWRPGGIEVLSLPAGRRAAGGRPPFVCDAIPFGDGSVLVIWDALPYRWDGGPLEPLGEPLEKPDGVMSAVTLADGSILGGFGRRLLRVYPSGRREQVLPLSNVMAVVAGAGDAIVIGEGDNPEGDLLKVWWPRTRELTGVQPDELGLDEPSLDLVYYAPPLELLVVSQDREWRALPWTHLAALPRRPAP